ncbi:TetR family transcriptional regulator [candidate division KSB1 bacterium]|nr:TetR family transcriptional regulator [candidate division KSB1 bacterium]
MAPKIVDKEAKKHEILIAAMSLFAKNGVIQTKMTDIAQATGIGKGTIYEYFRSKEDIFATAYEMIFNSTIDKVQSILNSSLEPEEKLRQLMSVTVDNFFHDGGKFAGIMMSFWSEGIRNKDDRIIDIIDLSKVYHEYRHIIAGILTEGIEKGYFRQMNTFMSASALIGAMDGILLQVILDPNLFSPQQAMETLLDMYLNGIKK